MDSKRNAKIKKSFHRKYEPEPKKESTFGFCDPKTVPTMPLFSEDFDDVTEEDFEDEGEKWIRSLIEQHKRER
jgi:hypothetical protein